MFDCLHEIHGQKIRQELKRVMEDDYFLKIFCGFGQDILRMKKDWHCYMEGAVDIQNMWLVWKEESPDECYDHCKRAVIKQLREKK